LAEDAENGLLGPSPTGRAPLLSIRDVKVFVGPAERFLRRAPRPRRALRALRVNRLPLPFSAPPRETPAREG